MRLRIAAAMAALSLLGILAVALALAMAMNDSQEEFIDAELASQIAYSMQLWRESPDAAFPNAPDMQLYRLPAGKPDGDGRSAIPAALASLPIGNHEVILDGKEHHVAVREDDSGRYILAYDVENYELHERGLLVSILVASLVLGLFALVAGYLLAGRLTRPLEHLATAVGNDAPGPLADAGMDRELLAVASALDAYRARQSAMVERERAFAANLSHEIRTPLTGIRTDAELLTGLPGLPEAAVRRGNRIIASVDRINGLAASLLLLAREAQPDAQSDVLLKPAIASVWEALTTGAPTPVVLRIDMPDGAAVAADPNLLELVLRNLLDNALRFSEAGEIVCRLVDRRLSVVDAGPGFAAEDLERVFDRHFVGRRGIHGLGLALVRHVCEACGWRAEVRNDAAGHGEVVIDFDGSLRRDR